MSPTLAQILAPTVLAARTVWLAMLAAIPCYVGVAWYLSSGVPPRELSPALTAACAALALALAGMVLALPRFFPADDLLRRLLAADPGEEALARDPRTGGATAAPSDTLGHLDPAERRLLLLRPIFTTQAVVRAALAESVALLGFVLAFLSASFTVVLPFAALSLALQLATMPRFEPLAERAREVASF